ncbi:transposase [Pediococcus acidilactici]|uniref:transposase n=1 Tax=Pediococcus acidilactici TaxID=1254 RepID=UPI002E7886DD|nr:transposase [Pediococcus acidilactici]
MVIPPAIFFYYSILSNSRFKTLQQNLIENFNKHLKRTTHHKEQFPTEDSLDRFLVSQFNVYNEKSLKRIHRGFKGLQDPLEASFI